MKNPPEGLPFGVHGSSFILDTGFEGEFRGFSHFSSENLAKSQPIRSARKRMGDIYLTNPRSDPLYGEI